MPHLAKDEKISKVFFVIIILFECIFPPLFLLLKYFSIFILYIEVFWLHVCMYIQGVQWPQKSEEDIRFYRAGVTNGCEMSCRCWGPNLVLCKSSQCSSPLSLLSRFSFTVLKFSFCFLFSSLFFLLKKNLSLATKCLSTKLAVLKKNFFLHCFSPFFFSFPPLVN